MESHAITDNQFQLFEIKLGCFSKSANHALILCSPESVFIKIYDQIFNPRNGLFSLVRNRYCRLLPRCNS